MSKLLTEQNFKDAATELGIEIAAIKAVAEVESRGAGFFDDGRPKILFEAHIFSSKTGHKYDDTHPNISSRKWNKKLYKGGTKEYDRLAEAKMLDESAAYQSASWGKFQVMGFNYKICGWNSIQQFIADMYKDEGQHLKSFLGFVNANSLTRHLKEKNWTAFAKGYNGPAYAENKYDIKMKEAYEKYSKNQILLTENDKPDEKKTLNSEPVVFGADMVSGGVFSKFIKFIKPK